MRLIILVWAAVAGTPSPAVAEAALVYRFESASVKGTVWVAGDRARRETEFKEDATRGPHVEISGEGGKRLLVLNPSDRTYYDAVAFRAKFTSPSPSLRTLNVSEPFTVARVEKVRVEVGALGELDAARVKGSPCRPVTLTLSYGLRLRMAMVGGLIPARVEGRGEFCLGEPLAVAALPFGHGLQIRSGLPEVDTLIAERLGALQGVPVSSALTVTRQIEGGESVTESSSVVLSDIRREEVASDLFELPREYQYKEPVVVAPVRRGP